MDLSRFLKVLRFEGSCSVCPSCNYASVSNLLIDGWSLWPLYQTDSLSTRDGSKVNTVWNKIPVTHHSDWTKVCSVIHYSLRIMSTSKHTHIFLIKTLVAIYSLTIVPRFVLSSDRQKKQPIVEQAILLSSSAIAWWWWTLLYLPWCILRILR